MNEESLNNKVSLIAIDCRVTFGHQIQVRCSASVFVVGLHRLLEQQRLNEYRHLLLSFWFALFL